MVVKSERPATKHLDDPTFIRAYAEAHARREQWRAGIEQLVREILELEEDHLRDPSAVPSAAEIRAEISQNIPPEEKFSDIVIAMREESP